MAAAKEECYDTFPLGQLENGKKRISREQENEDNYVIRDIHRQSPIFSEIITHPLILNAAKKVLGKGYFLTHFAMRKIPANTPDVLEAHRDSCGNLLEYCWMIMVLMRVNSEPQTPSDLPPPHLHQMT